MTADQFTIDLNYEHWFWLNPTIPALTVFYVGERLIQVSAHYATISYLLSFSGVDEGDE